MNLKKALLVCLLFYCGTNTYAESLSVANLINAKEIEQTKGIRISGTEPIKTKTLCRE